MTVRFVLMVVVATVALLLDTVVLVGLTLGGVSPSLLTLSVLGFAYADGAATGVRYGFAAGLATDLLGDGLLGSSALVLLLLGYVVGTGRRYWAGEPLPGQVLAGVVGSAAAALGHGLLDLLFGVEAGGLSSVLREAGISAVFGLVLSPLVLPVIGWLCRRYALAATSHDTWPSL